MHQETELKPTERPFVRFIFLRHHEFPKDPTLLLDMLSDVDVLFIEAVSRYETPEKRATGEKSLQLCLADPHTLDAQGQHEQNEAIANLGEHPNFVNDLIPLLAKSGKQLFYVDIDSQHPAQSQMEIVVQETVQVQYQLQRGHVREAREHLRIVCKCNAEVYRAREETVALQVQTIIKTLQEKGAPVRAAVIQGLVHTPTATLLDTSSIDVESYVADIPLPFKYQLWKKLRLGEDVTEHEYDQLLLIHYIFPQTIDLSERDLYVEYFTELVCSLSNEKAADLITQFEVFYRQAKERLTRTRGRLREEDIKIHSQSLFHEAARKTLQMATYWAE